MAQSNIFIDANIHFLKQGADFIGQLSAAHYTAASPPLYTRGIGPHFRHCLDHYVSFLAGVPGQQIDYDARIREPAIESDPLAAVAMIHELIDALQKFPKDQCGTTLQSKTDCGNTGGNPWSFSSVLRELQFLVSHTVHHYAIIGLIARHQGIEPGDDFGVAPSTLRYQESQSTCAQ